MKKIIAILVVSFAFNSFAQSRDENGVWQIDCRSIYEKTYIHKKVKKDKAYNVSSKVMYVTSVGAPAAPVLAMVIYPPAIAGMLYGAFESREEKVLELVDEYSSRIDKVMKKARDIDPEVTDEDVINIVEEAFKDGTFCSQLPKLYSYRQVKKYILEKIEANAPAKPNLKSK